MYNSFTEQELPDVTTLSERVSLDDRIRLEVERQVEEIVQQKIRDAVRQSLRQSTQEPIIVARVPQRRANDAIDNVTNDGSKRFTMELFADSLGSALLILIIYTSLSSFFLLPVDFTQLDSGGWNNNILLNWWVSISGLSVMLYIATTLIATLILGVVLSGSSQDPDSQIRWVFRIIHRGIAFGTAVVVGVFVIIVSYRFHQGSLGIPNLVGGVLVTVVVSVCVLFFTCTCSSLFRTAP